MPSPDRDPASGSSSANPPSSSAKRNVSSTMAKPPIDSPTPPSPAVLQKQRSQPPTGIVLPSPGSQFSQPPSASTSSPRQSHFRSSSSYRSITTPTGMESHGYSDTFMSPGGRGGPLSPALGSGNLNSNSFVFPIRSVFSGMSGGDGSGPSSNAEGSGSGLSRVVSRGKGGGGVAEARLRSSPATRAEDRRFSDALPIAEDDIGISSIAQMLEGQEEAAAEGSRPKPTGETGVATFSRKVDRGGGEGKARPPQHSPSGYGMPPSTSAGSMSSYHNATRYPHQPFFSAAALTHPEPADSPFFVAGVPDVRRASDGDDTQLDGPSGSGDGSGTVSGSGSGTPRTTIFSTPPSSGSTRPSLVEKDSGSTIHLEHKLGPSVSPRHISVDSQAQPTNPSAESGGSGLPDKTRAPVGQPQDAPAAVNFKDRPGPSGDPGEHLPFSAPGERESNGERSEPSGGSAKGASQRTGQESPSTHLAAPQPRHADASGFDGLTQVTKPLSAPRSESNFEDGNDGERSLINDFASIVRLADAGSLVGSGDGRTSSRSKPHGRRGSKRADVASADDSSLGPSGPTTQASLAQQQREIGKATAATRDTVQRFVSAQAHTQTMSDPNAHTPASGSGKVAPSPSRPLTEAGSDDDNEILDMGLSANTPDEAEPRELSRTSSRAEGASGALFSSSQPKTATTLSTRASSEIATASLSGREESEGESASRAEEDPEPLTTLRFEHVATEEGHHMVVGREGKLSKCEDEPITTPGAVQGFGVLIVLEEDYEKGTLLVRQVSENSTVLLGLSPKYLFRLDCFTRILTDQQEDLLRDSLDYLPEAEGSNALDEDGPQVFLLSGFGEPGTSDEEEEEDDGTASAGKGRRREWTCWVGAHRPKQPTWNKVDAKGLPVPPPNLVILEFELERDTINPLMQTFEPTIIVSSGRQSPDSASTSNSNSQSSNSNQPSQGSDTTVGTGTRPSGSPNLAADATRRPSAQTMNSEHTTQQSSTIRPDSSFGSEAASGLEGLEVDMPLERIIESTTNHAKPLRALERMRRSGGLGEDAQSGNGSARGSSRGSARGGKGAARRQQRRQQAGGTGAMDVFAVLGQINEQLGSAPDLDTFLKVVVGVVQDVCRFHRVLLYQFDESFNGQVVAELVEWGKTSDLYKGLMFPAADIPAQARQLYKINKVRMLYDRSQTTARMVLRDREDLDHPLDMTHCFLRAMSPIHIKYLANMHVRSSMSVSVMAFGELWGLIACHTYGNHGMRVSFPVRQMMRILSDSISRNVERLSYAQRLHTRKLISTIPSQSHPTGYIVSNADDLLQVFDADAGLLVIGSGCKLLGTSDQGQAMLAIAEYLRIVKFDTLKASNHLARDFPDLSLPKAHDTMAGLLYVPLTAKAGQDFIVFLRKGQAREVKWAGKPYKDERAGEAASLEPRKSFKTWSEVVTGRSRAWTDDQLESAGVLALIYGKFIQVWREKQSAMASNQLTAILLSNTSHAVRTPLSQIINTLELALAGNLDDETRAMLENSHKASRALLFHVHDLLDLTRIETGNETSFNDPFDLRASIQDAVRLYQTESARRGLEFRVNIAPNIPSQVIGDSRKIKTVISNLVANSVKFTPSGFIEVYCGLQHGEDDSEVVPGGSVMLEFVVADSGVGIANEKLQAMFVTLEGADEVMQETAPTGLGLGLAVVARIVEQLEGQLRAESEVGVGTRFFFTLEMRRHDPAQPRTRPNSGSSINHRRKSSLGSSGSVVSTRSGGVASEIDSFVHDFGSSHMYPSVGPQDPRLLAAEKRMNQPGTFPVTDSSWPVRPTRIADAESDSSDPSQASVEPASPSLMLDQARPSPQLKHARRLNYLKGTDNGSSSASGSGSRSDTGAGSIPTPARSRSSSKYTSGTASTAVPKSVSTMVPPKKRENSTGGLREKSAPDGSQRLRVLIVEDDMINAQILTRRLKMDKHIVLTATNGQEAVDLLSKDWDVDLVLMDIQMPIMDGRTSAAEIRKMEENLILRDDIDPVRVDGRIPIFAVSASLYESDRSNLSEHFDGWLLKPLDFTRARALIKALQDNEKRAEEVYVQGQWEKGGYFRGGKGESPLIK